MLTTPDPRPNDPPPAATCTWLSNCPDPATHRAEASPSAGPEGRADICAGHREMAERYGYTLTALGGPAVSPALDGEAG